LPGTRKGAWRRGPAHPRLRISNDRNLTILKTDLYNAGMSGMECRGISPEEMIRDMEDSVKPYRENKYAFQIGLKDLDFDVNEDIAKILGMPLPFHSINQAEEGLRNRVITPTKFFEDDSTEHLVMVFDHRPVGYSGFMDCVTHSLALTNHGLFEVGRYPAVSLNEQSRLWHWFLHRRLVTADEVLDWSNDHNYTADQFMEEVYLAMIS
jgi:hypothetical protein